MESLSRPEPVRRLPDRARQWVAWFGVGRLVASAAAVLIVCAGAFWLVRTSPPPTEASLPRTSSPPSSSLPGSSPTLAPPVGIPDDEAGSVAELTVHVAGAVEFPGVYRLRGDVRVHDAIGAAGGARPDGDVDALNLAAPVADGTRVYVPVVGETVPAPAGVDPATPVPGLVDLNRATAAELESLPGIGPATSAAIVSERERGGPFLDADELERVSGVGPATVARIRDLVTT